MNPSAPRLSPSIHLCQLVISHLLLSSLRPSLCPPHHSSFLLNFSLTLFSSVISINLASPAALHQASQTQWRDSAPTMDLFTCTWFLQEQVCVHFGCVWVWEDRKKRVCYRECFNIILKAIWCIFITVWSYNLEDHSFCFILEFACMFWHHLCW